MKSFSLLLPCLLLAIIVSETQASRILVLYPFSSKSITIFAYPILEALVDRGHEVVMVSPYKSPVKHPRFRDVFVNMTMETLQAQGIIPNNDKFNRDETTSLRNKIPLLWTDRFPKIAKIVFDNPEVMKFAEEDWDLIMMSTFMTEFMYGMAAKINKPIIMLSAGSMFPWLDSTTRNPRHYPYYNTSFVGFAAQGSVLQRTGEFLMAHAMDYMYEAIYLPGMRDAAVPYFGEDIPDFAEVRKNVSLVLTNSHYSIHAPRPHLPNIIEVGGAHCKPAGELPKNLADFAASSGDDGFIYFSLGSIAQGSKMPERCRREFVKAFSMIKQKVIWKWETEQMEGLPDNVLLVKWAPQQDILGHPKLRLFITHGGGMSMQESIYHEVPRIGFPLFAEQEMNMKNSEKMGIGISLDILNFTAEQLVHAINKIVKDESFKSNTKHVSSLFRDQYPPPLDQAVYWIEYVIRHNGAKEMRSFVTDIPWYQYNMLDVYALLATVVVVVLALVALILKITCKLVRKVFCGKKCAKKSKKE